MKRIITLLSVLLSCFSTHSLTIVKLIITFADMKVLIRFMTFLLAVQLSFPVSARKIDVDGLKVKISIFKKTAQVLGPADHDSFCKDSLIIPESFSVRGHKYRTVSIGGFANCKSLVYVSMPSTVETLERACFQGCVNIEEIVLPPLVEVIPEAFMESFQAYTFSPEQERITSRLRSVVLGKNVTTISNWAFAGSSIQQIVIPEKVKYIGAEALASFRTMTEVYCLSPEPPVIHIEYTPDEILDWSFQFLGPHNPGLNPPRTLYVPQGSLQSYQNAPGWRSFDNIREILPVPERLECGPEFSPDNFWLPEGVTVDSIIRKLPGVEVLSDGSITVNGRLVSKILLSNQLEAVGSTLQDDIFGLRIGMPVSEQEIVNLFNERYNAQVDIPSRKVSIVYHVRNIQYLGFDWNHVFLYVDKDDNTLKSVELNLLVPHNFDFAPTKEDSINIVTAKVGEALDSQYGEPTRNFGGTVWHGPNNVDIVLGVDRSARTAVSDPRREGLTTEAMIIQVRYLKSTGIRMLH